MLVNWQIAVDNILDHINNRGGAMSDWYVGIAYDYIQRLFTEHNVSRERDDWIYVGCLTSFDARTAEKTLHDLGCDGAPGGGDVNTNYVYAFRKTSMTKQ
jgi:hypothetical protein